MVTDEQVRLLRHKMIEKNRLVPASAAAGMSERSGRKWKQGPLPSETKVPRTWRTRPDPFVAVWQSEVVALLASDDKRVLEARTILGELERRHPGEFGEPQVRTLQRRMRDWRAVHGPQREVFFEQVHTAGREGALDFTHCEELGVTILGRPFEHLLFVFTLSFSGWTFIALAFGETFEALVAGLQGALWELGGVPDVVRHDNLSAATHELKQSGGRALNARWGAVLEHYGVRSTRITPGESHENGVAEKSNQDVKKAIDQALVLRGSRDFASDESYVTFARDVVERTCNRTAATKLALEREKLQPLPRMPVPSYTTLHPTVRRWSTIRVGGRTYSVPSRLIGHEVEVRRYPDTIEVLYRAEIVETMPRLRGQEEHRIDYRHVIWSLVRKPGAFARYRYREELFPSLSFRRAYDALRSWKHDRADVEYVRILHLAASTLESTVEHALCVLLERGGAFDYAQVKAIASPEPMRVPELSIGEADLRTYDALLGGAS